MYCDGNLKKLRDGYGEEQIEVLTQRKRAAGLKRNRRLLGFLRAADSFLQFSKALSDEKEEAGRIWIFMHLVNLLLLIITELCSRCRPSISFDIAA